MQFFAPNNSQPLCSCFSNRLLFYTAFAYANGVLTPLAYDKILQLYFFCPVWSGVFSVIARAKARNNLARADFKLSEVKKSKLDKNGLLMDFVFQCSSPKGEGATHVTFSQDCSALPSLKCGARWGAIQNRSPSLPLSKRDI